MGLLLHVDGGARGNPGPAGAGVVLRDERGKLLFEAGFFLGHQTNNAAEYHALLRGLERVILQPPQPLIIHSDSELLVKQLTGSYQVRNPKLGLLYREAQMRLLKIRHWTVKHVPREQNLRADQLANMAMDRGADVITFEGKVGAAGAGEPAVLQPPEDELLDRPPMSGAAAPTSGATGGMQDIAGVEVEVSGRTVRVLVATPPAPGACPAGGLPGTDLTIGTALPAGLCIHAAHAILPTLLGMFNTEPGEFAAIPTLTVRCGRPGCRAVFKLTPVPSNNGRPH
jgi:ribonuclease HI